MDNAACLTLARVITGVLKKANMPAVETPAKINFAARVILFNSHPVFCSSDYAILLHCSNQVSRHDQHRHKRKYEIEHKQSAENGGAREGRLGGEEIGTRLVPLSSCISSFCDRRNTHRDKREKRTGSSLMSLKHIPCKFCLSNSCGSNGIKALRNAPKLPLRPCPGVHNTLEELFEK